MPDEIGAILREAREAHGLTLAQAREKTRINARFLDALESGQYELLPSAVHIRGYLRNYARFLELDARPLLERYELDKDSRPTPTAAAVNDRPADFGAPITQPNGQVFYEPVNLDMDGRRVRASGSIQRLAIIVALLISLALIGSRFLPVLLGTEASGQGLSGDIGAAVGSVLGGTPAAAGAPTTDPTLLPGGAVITSTSRNEIVQLPTVAPTRPQLPVTLDVIRLKLEITERTWLQVTIDGEVVFEGLGRKGDLPYEWVAQQSATLRTGNAIGIFVTINDIALGKLGGRGQVVEETWTTTRSQ